MVRCSLIFRRPWKNAVSKAFAGLDRAQGGAVVLSRLCSLWPIAAVNGMVVHDI